MEEEVLREWRRMTAALRKEQTMELEEVAEALNIRHEDWKAILRSHAQPRDADRITAVLQDLRSPFDDERLVRKKFINVA